MTHCEAALLDGYGPYSGDAETRWTCVYARFTRRRTDEAGWGHTARQSSLVFRTQ